MKQNKKINKPNIIITILIICLCLQFPFFSKGQLQHMGRTGTFYHAGGLVLVTNRSSDGAIGWSNAETKKTYTGIGFAPNRKLALYLSPYNPIDKIPPTIIIGNGTSIKMAKWKYNSDSVLYKLQVFNGIVSDGLNCTINILPAHTKWQGFTSIFNEGIGDFFDFLGSRNPQQSTWADYVFDPQYKLMPLNEVEDFIAKNGHLPEIPSAVEIEKDGLKLSRVMKLQMQKIEELTLYLIEQKKKTTRLEKDIDALLEKKKL